MARSLKVVFRGDVRGIAQAGDVKMVSPGYARNFLFPRKLAFPASEAALRQWDTERQGTLAKVARGREQSQVLAQQIEAASCTIPVKARSDGHLFGSVNRQEIVAALAQQGVVLEKRAILLSEPIRQVGPTQVSVRLKAGQQVSLKVNVVPETESQ